ncbi:MAG: CPBP family glutamic-type intramembrane protease [Pseudomonadota bacterium]
MTTSPQTGSLTPAEIEATFGDAPLASDAAGGLSSASSVKAEWARFGAFLKRPVLPHTPLPLSQAPKGTGRIFVLDLLVMLVMIGTLVAVTSLGVELPENINSTLEPGLATFALVALAAPLGEELAFRSWLSGRPGHLLAIALVIAGGLGAAIFSQIQPLASAAIAIAGLVGAISAVIMLRGRPPMVWFVRAFPIFFWLSTIGFALIHLLNYTEGTLIVTLVLVTPQFVLGAMLGYVRVHFGLMAAIGLHAAHNFTLFGLAALAMLAGAPQG